MLKNEKFSYKYNFNTRIRITLKHYSYSIHEDLEIDKKFSGQMLIWKKNLYLIILF